MAEISRKEWEAATRSYVVVIVWAPKPKYKNQVPTIRVAGDYPTYAKARAAKKKLEKKDLSYVDTDRRTVYVSRKFDVEKLDLFDSYLIKEDSE